MPSHFPRQGFVWASTPLFTLTSFNRGDHCKTSEYFSQSMKQETKLITKKVGTHLITHLIFLIFALL